VSPRRRPSREVTNAWKLQFQGVIFSMLESLVKAENTEEDFASFGSRLRQLTRKQFRRVAETVGSYYVDHAGASPGDLSKRQSKALYKRALEKALRDLDAGR